MFDQSLEVLHDVDPNDHLGKERYIKFWILEYEQEYVHKVLILR